jgi:DNA polymerase III alpha subunit
VPAYVPLQCASHFSLRLSPSRGWQIAARARQLGLAACAITDHDTLAGVPSFLKACKEACRHCGHQPDRHSGGKGRCLLPGFDCPAYDPLPLTPLVGCRFGLPAAGGRSQSVTVIARDLAGWRALVAASSEANRPENCPAGRPSLPLARLAELAGGRWLALAGGPGTPPGDGVFTDPAAAFAATTAEAARSFLRPQSELRPSLLRWAGKFKEAFGPGAALQVNLLDLPNCPAAGLLAAAVRWLGPRAGLPVVACPDPHYCAPEDAPDQRVLLAAKMRTTLAAAGRPLLAPENAPLGRFFRSSRHHVPAPAEAVEACGEAECDASAALASLCEPFSILSPPRLPTFDCPGGQDANAFFRQALADGYRRKIAGEVPDAELPAYRARLAEEAKVLCGVGLAPYFLVVQDFNRFAQAGGMKRSRGRGSAAGSLAAYALDIHDTDSLKYELLFERFFNAARFDPAKGRYKLPDIDCDFPRRRRGEIYEYVKGKYGDDRVSRMATYSRLKGRSALTVVFAAHGWGTFDERKAVTKHVPDESAVADDLQESREEDGEASLVRWALENNAEKLADWCGLDGDNRFDGPLAAYFAQAERLEGVAQSRSTHASGVVISPVPVAAECPAVYDDAGEAVAAFEMNDLEACGFVKFDILGVAALDKIAGACRTLRTGIVTRT